MSSSGKKIGPEASGTLASLWEVLQAVMDDAEPTLGALGLSIKAFFLLEAVAGHPFPAELARKMHLPPPTVTYLVKQLEEKGFLERRAEAGDLRKFRLIETAEGQKALKKGQRAIGSVLEDRLRRLTADEAETFDRIVKKLVAPGDSSG